MVGWQRTQHWGQSEENPSRCQLPSWERVGGSIYNKKDKPTLALVCKQEERRGGYWAVVICHFSKTQTRVIWQKQRERRKAPSTKQVTQGDL